MRESGFGDTLLRAGLGLNFVLLLVSLFGSLIGLWSLVMATDSTEMFISGWFIFQPVLHLVGHRQGWANYGLDNLKTAGSVAIPTALFVSLLLSVWMLYW